MLSGPLPTYSVGYNGELDIAVQKLSKDRQVVLPDVSLLTILYCKANISSIFCTALSISYQGVAKSSQYLVCKVTGLVSCAVLSKDLFTKSIVTSVWERITNAFND